MPPWPCGELDQALTAFAGEASAQVVLVAGEGIGDGGAALLETDRPRRQPGLLRGQLQLPSIDVLLAPLPPEELDALEAPLPWPEPEWPHVGLVRLQLLQDRPCLVVWSRSVVASERLHSWLEIQGAGGLGQSAIQGGETGATLTAQQV